MNDFLIDGETPADDDIVCEVRENWHPKKKRFSPELCSAGSAWMRDHALVPRGRGVSTRSQRALPLQ